MKFEWDSKKAALNLNKHDVAFEVAIEAFDDPFALIAPDPSHSQHEERAWLIGESDTGQCVVVVFTLRAGGHITRLISARPASRKERRVYEASKIIPI